MQYSQKLSLTKLFLFSTLSFGLYNFYWLYRFWSYTRNKEIDVANPALKLIGLLVPILNLVIIYDTCKAMFELCKPKVEFNWFTNQIFALIILAMIVARIVSNQFDGLISFLIIPAIVVLPFMILQNTLNKYFSKIEKAKLPVKSIERGDVVVGIIAIVLWILLFVMSFVTF